MARKSTLSVLGLVVMVTCGCRLGPDLEGCRIVGARASHEANGDYRVLVHVQNKRPEPVDLADLHFELTTFDAQDRVLQEKLSFVARGEIQRYDDDSIPLITVDRDRRVKSCHVFLKDQRGRLLSECPVNSSRFASRNASAQR